MEQHERVAAIIRSAQDTVDSWRRNPNRKSLNSALQVAADEYHRLGVFTSKLDRETFRRIAYAIQANVGHGYTNPERLIDLAYDILDMRRPVQRFLRERVPSGKGQPFQGDWTQHSS